MKDVSAIVYTSNTGFTRRYAQMLSRAAAIPAYDLADAALPADGAPVVYLGWLSAGRITGLPKAQKRWSIQAVCAVGMSPNNDPETVAKANRVECPLFCVQGGYAPEKLRGANKAVMSVVTRLIAFAESKNANSPEEKAQLAQFRTGCDFVNESNLAPVLAWLREEKHD